MVLTKIVLGDLASPILTFETNDIIHVYEDTSVSLVGDKLAIDQFLPDLRYAVSVRYVFKPTNYDRFITSDGLVMCGHYNYDLRKLPYGTQVTFYTDNRVAGVYYAESVEREAADSFRINAVSAVGLWDKQPSKGNIYDGDSFSSVLAEILGNDIAYTVTDDVAALSVYGWVPYGTKRENLHKLLNAYGVSLIKSDAGVPLFTFLLAQTPASIPAARIYTGGTVTYDKPASRVEVTEHAFHYLASTPQETLFDNTRSDAVTDALITFDQPIYPASLQAQAGTNLTIQEAGVNYAIVSGLGVLLGTPYVHTTRIVAADNASASGEKVVQLSDNTLITLVNSENALIRVAEYYFNSQRFKNPIKIENERAGRQYELLNAFGEYASGFLTKMRENVSAVIKGECEFVANYIPRGQGASYTNVLFLPASSGTWQIPQAVFDKVSPTIRVVLIGNGEKGAAGQAGAQGAKADITDLAPGLRAAPGVGGAGGAGGTGGAGGKVYSITIDCTGRTSFSYGRTAAGDTYFNGSGGLALSSADGVSSPTGFLEIFSGTVYALPGNPGQAGGAGGDGGYWRRDDNYDIYAESGANVTYGGQTWVGGAPGERYIGPAPSWTNELLYGGNGGGGAAVGSNGGSGSEPDCGRGANAGAPNAPPAIYGFGGNGGHGGGGSGGAGVVSNYNWYEGLVVAGLSDTPAAPGNGSAGSSGYQGVVIIYF